MKVFTDLQKIQLQNATVDYGPDSKGCMDLDGDGIYHVYGGPMDGQPCNPDGGSIMAPNRPGVIIATPNEKYGFTCPVKGGAGCLESVPRDDITENVYFTTDVSNAQGTVDIPTDNARGMYLCSISGFVAPTFAPDVTFTDVEYQIAVDELKNAATVTLRFRGKDVPGFTEIPVGEVFKVAGDKCCTAERMEINCIVPDYGALELYYNNFRADFPQVDTWGTAARVRFSGCGCPEARGCSCGGH